MNIFFLEKQINAIPTLYTYKLKQISILIETVGDDITPNSDGWYLSKNNKNVIH